MRVHIRKVILIFIYYCAFSCITYAQQITWETADRPRYCPAGVKDRNVTNEKGRQGVWKAYARTRTLLWAVTYKNGIKNGVYTLYYSTNGAAREEGSYYWGTKDGEVKKYFINGELKEEGSYKVGKRSGKWITYNKSSGEKRSEGEYEANRKIGTWTFYNSKGVKISEGSYVNGRREGVWQFYGKDGKSKGSVNYIKGVAQLTENAETKTTPKKTPPKKTPPKGNTEAPKEK